MTTNYRVNFGQGQVHYAGNRKACERFIADHGDGSTYLQFQDPDTAEWFRCRAKRAS